MNVTENRTERLARDYREMLKIQNRPYLKWIVTKGDPPYAEEYLLDVAVRTYVLSAENGRYIVRPVRRCVVSVTLRDPYPHVAPYIRMLSIPPVFHPRWYSKGSYCAAEPWRAEDPLKEYVLRMIGTLRYDPDLTDTAAPANYKALDWYRRRRDDAALFPCDTTALTENSAAEIDAITAAPVEIADSWPVG